MLTHETLQNRLSAPFRYHASVDSSNDLAINWLKSGALAGSVIIADEQRKGRGRKGRTWYTPPGVALALSVILKPPPQAAGRVSMLAAVSVAELAESLNIPQVGIKWPNDVQIAGKKVCGILPEAVWERDKLVGVVLGMGVNVRVKFEGDLIETATSLQHHVADELNRVDLIAYLMQRIEAWSQLISGDALFRAWYSRLNTIGQHVTINELQGIVKDVTEEGTLLLKTPSGKIERIIAGDVYLTPPDTA
ncbi:MAG: biotin--[acetyl-CoA-carboxylase] ligase [Aggregatilineales bacterium]